MKKLVLRFFKTKLGKKMLAELITDFVDFAVSKAIVELGEEKLPRMIGEAAKRIAINEFVEKR
jgi:hypothetical protein